MSTKGQMAYGSCRGQSHHRSNMPNQDGVMVKQNRHGTILAIGDGVGTHRYSRLGSHSVVAAVHRAFGDYVNGAILRQDITNTITKYYVEALSPQAKGESATTCIFIAHIYEEGVFFGQIGDGLCLYALDGQVKTLLEKTDDFANEVKPLDDRYPPKWKTRWIPADKLTTFQALLATDGISEDIIQTQRGAFLAYVAGLIQGKSRRKADGILRDILVRWPTPKSWDDKTLAVYLWR